MQDNIRLTPLIRHTRFYQEAFEEGRLEGREKVQKEQLAYLIVRLLKKRFGQELTQEVRARIESLPLLTLETLSEDLLDFNGLDDLKPWLDARRI